MWGDWSKYALSVAFNLWASAIDRVADVIMPSNFGISDHIRRDNDKQQKLF